MRTFVSLPPRYAAWQDAAVLPHPPDEVSVLQPGEAPPMGLAAGPTLASNRPVRLRITSPEHKVRLLRDPETPADLSTVALTVVVDPPVRPVLYVDAAPTRRGLPLNRPLALQPGEHTFRSRSLGPRARPMCGVVQ